MNVNDVKLLKEMQHNCKGILKVSNHLLHYDFTQNFNVYKIVGKFTVKQIEKTIDGFTGKNILLFTCDTCGYYSNRYFITQICSNGSINIDFKLYSIKYDIRVFDTFYKKGSFEEYRKNDKTITYIISQAAAAAVTPARDYMDYTGRIKIKAGWDGVRKTGDGRGRSWVSEIGATDSRGKSITYHPGHRDAAAVNNIVDKSGYIVDYYRTQLLTRAAAYKAAKRRDEYINAVNVESVDILRDKIEKMKALFIEKFTAAADYESIYKMRDILSYRYTGIYRDFEIYREKTIKKEYASIAASEKAFNIIVEDINVIMDKLNGGKKDD